MGIVNKDPDLFDMFQDINRRLRRLESAKSFNIPYMTADPPQPQNGDMWINTTDKKLYVWYKNARVTIFTFAT